jgi:energy-coupling factor transporter ATP-binding protein EcfA2
MRADLAAALLHDPEIVFLDEPTIGLDVLAKDRMREFIREINSAREVTIILTTHDLGDVEKLCRRVMLIAEGRLLFDGAWWLHPEYRFNHAAFIPSLMSPSQLTDAGFHCRARFNSAASILRRALDPSTNMRSLLKLGIYAVYAPLFRRETFKKQGMRLGLLHED